MTLRDALFAETVTVTHLGYTFTVSDLSSGSWLPAISHPGRDVLVARDLMTDESRDKLSDLSEEGRFLTRDVHMLSRKMITEASARPWWETLALLSNIWDGGELLGAMMKTGVRISDTRLAELTALSFSLYTSNMDEKDRFKFEAKLTTPPVWAEPDELMNWDDGLDFVSQAKALRGMPGMSVG